MKNIKNGQIHKVCCFDKKDFIEHNEEINNMMLSILVSHENKDDSFDINESKDYINELNVDILTNDFLQARLYVLLDEKNGIPISFALYSQDQTRDDWHLEFISTNKDYCGMGYAEAIFLISAKDIANTKFPYISSVVNEENLASLQLHEALSKIKGIKLQSAKIDNEDELYDSYQDDNSDYDNYETQSHTYSNRISFLFDVKSLKDQKKLKNVDDIVL